MAFDYSENYIETGKSMKSMKGFSFCFTVLKYDFFINKVFTLTFILSGIQKHKIVYISRSRVMLQHRDISFLYLHTGPDFLNHVLSAHSVLCTAPWL